VQEFVVRNDCACGSTIGPILATQLGLRTCDVGMPQLSMHSCREMMGADDLSNCHALLAAFFQSFRDVDAQVHACAPPRIE
jgi:aspartyl aminopeptidase